jgi:uncharacterized membrane protein YesL
MPGFWKTLKRWIGTSYDNLGLVLMCSLAWAVAGATFLAIDQFSSHGNLWVFSTGAALIYVLVLSPLAAGAFAVARMMLTHDSPTVKDFFLGVRDHFSGAIGLGFAQVSITAILVVSVWFYRHFTQVILRGLAFLSVDLLLFWAMSCIYHFPLLVEQRLSAYKIIKKSALLVIGGFAFTVGIFFVIILLTYLSVLSRILLPLIYLGMVSILGTLALRAMLIKYGVLEPDPEPIDEGFHVGDV